MQNNKNNRSGADDRRLKTPVYKPYALSRTDRILLPARFSMAGVLLLLFVASAVVFVWLQPDNVGRKPAAEIALVSPIARAEAAPIVVLPPTDPRLDEVAALIPEAATKPLPGGKPRDTETVHAVNLTVRASPHAPQHVPSELERLTAQGIAYGRSGDYPAAERALRAALALDPGNPAILYNLGAVAERGGDPATARTLYEAALIGGADRPDTPLRPELVVARLNALDPGGDPEGSE